MDASGFEATAPDDPDPPLSDVLDLMEDDFKYAIIGAIAVVKHVARLVVLIVALATSVVIYCFVLCWLCLLYLQTRLLLFNSTMLRLCMDEPRHKLSIVAEPVHRPESTSEQEDQDTLVTPQAAEEPQSSLDQVMEPLITEEQRQGLSPTSKPHRRPQLHKEWTTPTLYSEGRPLSEDVHDNKSAVRGAEVEGDAIAKTKHPELASFDQTYEPASEPWSGEEPWPHDKYDGNLEAIEEWKGHEPSNGVPPATSWAPKLSKEKQKAQEQRSWLDQMHASPLKGPRGRTSYTATTATQPAPQAKRLTNPFATTADQLDEVRRFNNDATKGGQKARPSAENRPSNASARRPNRPGSYHVQTTKPFLMHSRNRTLSSSPAPHGVSNRAANMPTSTSATAGPPPHQRAAAEGRARTAAAAAGASSSLAQSGTNSTSTAPQATVQRAAIAQAGGIQGYGQPATTATTSAVGHDVQAGDSSQLASSSQQSVSAEAREGVTTSNEPPKKLNFYKGTPAVTNPAAKSAEFLKSRRPAARIPEQTQELQREGNDAALDVFRSQPHVEAPVGFDPVTAPVNKADEERLHPAIETAGRTEKKLVDLTTEDYEATQQALPSAEEFDAALAAFQRQDDEQARKSAWSQPSATSQDQSGEADKLSARKEDVRRQAVEIIQKQVLLLQGLGCISKADPPKSTSTGANARKSPKSIRKTGQKDLAPVTTNVEANGKTSSKENSAPGGRPSRLLPNAPAFFAPAPVSTGVTAPPAQAHSTPPASLVPQHASNTAPSRPCHGTSDTPFVSRPGPTNLSQLQPFQTQGTHTFPDGLTLGSPYTHGAGTPFFPPQMAASSSTPPNIMPPAHYSDVPVDAYSSVPSSSTAGVAAPGTRYAIGHVGNASRIDGSNVITSLPAPRFPGYFGHSSMSGFDASQVALQTPSDDSSYQWGTDRMRPPISSGNHTAPNRRPSLAAPIVRPQPRAATPPAKMTPAVSRPSVPATIQPVSAAHLSDTNLLAPALPFDSQSEKTSPSLLTAQASSEVQITQVPKPPGLGEAQPKRQAAFDAILSEPTAITPVFQSDSLAHELETPSSPLVKPVQFVTPATGKSIDVGSLKLRQAMEAKTAMRTISKTPDPASLKEFAQTFKLPDFGSKSGQACQSHLHETSASIDVLMQDDKALVQKNVKESGGDEVYDAVSPPQKARTDAEDENATKEEPAAASDSKRAKREEKKAVREALLEAWCKRDDARRKVASSWSIELATALRETTRIYHEQRDELASLMASGKLNEEDTKAFPRFPDMDLSAPRNRPEGAAELQRKRREDRLPRAGAIVDAGDAGDAGEEDSTGPASPSQPGLDDLKDKLKTARKLRQDAVDHFKQPRPQSNVSYQTWRARGDAKLDRANKLYRSKRKVLVEAFSGELPEDLAAEFPLL